MSNHIIYIDRSRIRSGSLGELKRAIPELVDFIETSEPQLISYGFYLDEQASRMTVVAVHPDADSLGLHMQVGAAAFRGFAEFIEMEAIEVYGELTNGVLEQLQQKADALGESGQVVVDRLHSGFSRMSVPAASPPTA